ncbi:MAG: hypothetical protein HQM09_19360 [Candidatus Riflebacteria bacterium]|nr:hypothetical protein [Candidatus Riflebacteria bacterium]
MTCRTAMYTVVSKKGDPADHYEREMIAANLADIHGYGNPKLYYDVLDSTTALKKLCGAEKESTVVIFESDVDISDSMKIFSAVSILLKNKCDVLFTQLTDQFSNE